MKCYIIFFLLLLGSLFMFNSEVRGDLRQIKERGVLLHLGVPYARFVTGGKDGLDVEIVQLFAKELDVEYQYVKTSWSSVLGDLTGKNVKPVANDVRILGQTQIKGDIIGNGLTILPWRKKVIDYSTPYFPTQVWVIARTDSQLRPITPAENIDKDIVSVKTMLKGYKVMGKKSTCLDPRLYDLTGVYIIESNLGIDELGPCVIKGVSDTALLEVASVLVDIQKYPGRLKVLGPVSQIQLMGFGFSKESPELRMAFNRFLEKLKQKGIYMALIKKYYSGIDQYFPEWFDKFGTK